MWQNTEEEEDSDCHYNVFCSFHDQLFVLCMVIVIMMFFVNFVNLNFDCL